MTLYHAIPARKTEHTHTHKETNIQNDPKRMFNHVKMNPHRSTPFHPPSAVFAKTGTKTGPLRLHPVHRSIHRIPAGPDRMPSAASSSETRGCKCAARSRTWVRCHAGMKEELRSQTLNRHRCLPWTPS